MRIKKRAKSGMFRGYRPLMKRREDRMDTTWFKLWEAYRNAGPDNINAFLEQHPAE